MRCFFLWRWVSYFPRVCGVLNKCDLNAFILRYLTLINFPLDCFSAALRIAGGLKLCTSKLCFLASTWRPCMYALWAVFKSHCWRQIYTDVLYVWGKKKICWEGGRNIYLWKLHNRATMDGRRHWRMEWSGTGEMFGFFRGLIWWCLIAHKSQPRTGFRNSTEPGGKKRLHRRQNRSTRVRNAHDDEDEVAVSAD